EAEARSKGRRGVLVERDAPLKVEPANAGRGVDPIDVHSGAHESGGRPALRPFVVEGATEGIDEPRLVLDHPVDGGARSRIEIADEDAVATRSPMRDRVRDPPR